MLRNSMRYERWFKSDVTNYFDHLNPESGDDRKKKKQEGTIRHSYKRLFMK